MLQPLSLCERSLFKIIYTDQLKQKIQKQFEQLLSISETLNYDNNQQPAATAQPPHSNKTGRIFKKSNIFKRPCVISQLYLKGDDVEYRFAEVAPMNLTLSPKPVHRYIKETEIQNKEQAVL